MNVEVRPTRTAADETLVKAFADACATLPGGAYVKAQREVAFGRFKACGLPNKRVEQWKYTDLRAFMRETKPLAAVPGKAERRRAKAAGATFAGLEPRRIVFVDGCVAPELSDLSALEPGLTITSLSEALAASAPEVMRRIADPAIGQGDIAYALNTAFMADGVVIRVAADTHIGRPIHLVFAHCSDRGSAVFTRTQIVVAERARLTLLESHERYGAADYQVNSALDVIVGAEAQLDHVKLGADADGALHVSTIDATLGANAQLNDFALTLGGAMVRNQLFVTCQGHGAQIDLRGASLLHGRQHVDTTLVLDHAVGGCKSRELFKAVLEDESRSVFQGKIIVRPKAQKTDARMMTRSLLLSEMAESNSKPELEIFADDVQCGHGATSGALDDQLKFYLMARGIPAKEAEALLIEAFIGEAIDGVAHEGVREVLAAVVAAKLKGRG